jgi:outer membrane receptor protein involved in Fe transport
MSDFRIFEKHRLIIGARLENYRQVFAYVESGSNIDKKQDTTVLDILPSVNYVFNAGPRLNFRAAYYRTVSRPEFRELAPFAFYNFVQLNIWSGDPNLKRALIDNYDLRVEWFPGGGQVLSVTGFYKYFKNPVEAVQRTGVSGDPELYYTNANKVTNIGAELEYRINLSFLSKDSDLFFDNITLYSNLSIIRSRVDTTGILGAEIRPLQGQSPYIINAGLNYVLPKTGINFSASYNVVGPRIFVVGNVQEPNVWEKERHVLDLQLSKSFLKKQNLELRLNVRDIIANDQIFYQDLNKNGKYDKKENSLDNVTRRISFGPTFTFAISYKF